MVHVKTGIAREEGCKRRNVVVVVVGVIHEDRRFW